MYVHLLDFLATVGTADVGVVVLVVFLFRFRVHVTVTNTDGVTTYTVKVTL